MRLPVCLALLAAGGCTTLEESQSTDEIVVAAAPYRNDSPYSYLPDLGTSGFGAAGAPTATDASSIHEPTFSNGVTSKAAPLADRTAWHTIAAGGPGGSWTQFESAPTFASDLGAAESDADAVMAADDSQLADIKSFLDLLPLAIHTDTSTSQSFVGWAAEQARWLRSAYVVTSSTGAMTNEVYTDPSFGNEIRDRGARLYCAARAAAFNQASTGQASMGQQAAASFTLFGQKIQLGVIEPTFRLDVPKKHIASSGTQTFEVPFQIGAQVTPIGGLGLPSFPELRYPVSLITGDTEVASALPAQKLHTGDFLFCFPGSSCTKLATYTTASPKDYLTVTHADGVRSRTATLATHSDEIPLFSIGAFTVTFHLGGDIHVGSPTAPVPDDRLLQGIPSWWPLVSRAGEQSPAPWPGYNYDTEAWSPGASLDAAPGAASPFYLSGAGTSLSFGPSDPLLMRTLADDDHHFQASTGLGLFGTVTGKFPFNLGIAALELRGDGTISVDGNLNMDVRDGEMAMAYVPAPNTPPAAAIPMTAVTATPSTSATVGVNFVVTLHIVIPLGFTSIDETITFINAGTSKTWAGSPWPQQNRALIATGSSWGNPRTQPWAVSHLPFSGSPSSSFPAYPVFDSFAQDVDSCLADPKQPPPPPPPCHNDTTSTPPHGNVCVFSGSWLRTNNVGAGYPAAWAGTCSAIPSHVDAILGTSATPAQKQCYVDALTAICKPTSREQDWNGQHGVAHIIDTLHPATEMDLGALAKECTAAFSPTDPTVTFNKIFEFGACDDGATMIDPGKVLVPDGTPDGVAPPVTTGNCH